MNLNFENNDKFERKFYPTLPVPLAETKTYPYEKIKNKDIIKLMNLNFRSLSARSCWNFPKKSSCFFNFRTKKMVVVGHDIKP